MGRYAVISDIHGNLYALQAVLAHMADLNVSELICLGDIVGYGPYPCECLDLVVKYSTHTVRGNHDEAVVDPLCADVFNGAAREAIFWTRDVIGPLHLNALNQLPAEHRLGLKGEIHCVHDTPHACSTRYVHDKKIAAHAFHGVSTPLCLLGHTHVPMVFEAPRHGGEPLNAQDITAYIPGHEVEIELREDHRYICNPGSVGQPRDCDPRASFAVLDWDARTFTVHRVEYDIAAAQKATQDAGLPTILADRLAIGA